MAEVIITTGMHRSGTSLVSSLLQEAGVHVGERLIAANSANPRGYFEDVDFYEFHEQLLHDRGQSYLYVAPDFDFEPTTAEWERGAELVRERAKRPVWGWKDPRTCLFLKFWHEQLPEARFLFVFRHPLAVLLSLLRRGEFDNHPGLLAGLDAWQLYNARLRAFYDAHPDQCVLVPIEALVGQFEQFTHLLRQKLGLGVELESGAIERVFHAQELQAASFSAEVGDVMAMLAPDQMALYDQLHAGADLRVAAGAAEAAGSPSLSALVSLATALDQPISLAIKQSLLQLVVSLLAPKPAELMLTHLNHNAQSAQQRIDEIWMHAQRLERLNVEQEDRLKAEQTKLLEQQAQLRLQELRIRDQELRILDQQRRIRDQEARIRDQEVRIGDQEERIGEQQARIGDQAERIGEQEERIGDQEVRLGDRGAQIEDQARQLQKRQQELRNQAAQIQALLAELAEVHETRTWKVMHAYSNLKERWHGKVS